jgi:twitching motility protein PilI
MSKLDLRSFQQEITERLAVARRTTGEAPRLAFTAGDQRYALPLSEVSEVAPLVEASTVPGTHSWFMGLTNVRGAVISLVHLGALLHQRQAQHNANSRVLVLGGDYARLRCGLLVDSVAGLRPIASVAEWTHGTAWARKIGTDASGTDWAMMELAVIARSTGFLSVMPESALA